MRATCGNRVAILSVAAMVGLLGMALPASGALKSKFGKEHGTTTVNLPDPMYTVRVATNGTITGTGSRASVTHADPGLFCNKVSRIGMFLNGKCNGQGCSHFPSPGHREFKLCNFNANDTPFDFVFPGINVPSQLYDVANGFAAACRASGKNGTTFVTKHPWFNESLSFSMMYENGDYYQAVYDAPNVMLTCDPCPPITVKDTLQLMPDAMVTIPASSLASGGAAPYTISFTNLPSGLIYTSGTLTGRPAAGSYKGTITVYDSCKTSSANKVTKNFEFQVKDTTPAVLSGASVTPATLPVNGGTIQIKVTATDNKGVAAVAANVQSSTGAAQAVVLTRSAGTAQNGVWQGSYQAPANTTGKPLKYVIALRASDTDNNFTDLPASAATSVTVDGSDKVPPKIAAVTVNPTAFDYTGGQVTVSVTATDDIGVQTVTMYLTRPDGNRSGMRLPKTGGTMQSGEWKTAWTVPPNTGATPLTYWVQIAVADSGTNMATSQPVSFTLPAAPQGAKPFNKPSVQPAQPYQPPQPPKPTRPMLPGR